MSAWGAVAQAAIQTKSVQRGDSKFANWLYGDGAAEAGKDAETYMNKAYPGTTPLERLGGGGGGSGGYIGAEISNKSALSGAQASVMSTGISAKAQKYSADKAVEAAEINAETAKENKQVDKEIAVSTRHPLGAPLQIGGEASKAYDESKKAKKAAENLEGQEKRMMQRLLMKHKGDYYEAWKELKWRKSQEFHAAPTQAVK